MQDETTPGVHEIDLSSVDGAFESLKRLQEELAVLAAKQLETLEEEKLAAQEIEKVIQKRQARVERKIAKASAKADRLRKEFAEAVDRRDSLQATQYGLITELGRARRTKTIQERKQNQLETRLGVSPDREIKGASLLLTGLGEQVEAGTLQMDTTSRTLSWTTTPIRIRNGFGGYLSRDYGRFEITMGLKAIELSTSLDVVVKSLDSQLNNPHPHTNDSHACLGTAQEVLLAALQEGDYTTAISTMMEFMEDYNHRNPYKSIDCYGDLSRWTTPVCGTEEHIMAECTCTRCVSCSRVAAGPEAPTPVHLQDCGSCSTCCNKHHQHDLESLGGTGINGSSCELRSLNG